MKRTLLLGSLTAIALAVVYVGCMGGSESGDDLCCDASDTGRPDGPSDADTAGDRSGADAEDRKSVV